MISTDDDKRLGLSVNALADAILSLCGILRGSPTLNYQSDTAKGLDNAEQLATLAKDRVHAVNRGAAIEQGDTDAHLHHI